MTDDIVTDRYHLHLGDCLEFMRTLPNGAVDAVITDPPYGVGLTGKRQKTRSGDTVVVKPGHYIHEDTPEYVRSVVVPAIEECRRLSDIVVLTPGTRNLWEYPQPDDLGVFYSGAGTGRGKWGFTCASPILYYGRDPYYRYGLGGRPNSCGQTYPNDANTIDHPCAKPIRWAIWLVIRASLEGMTVFDPFMGSGTTGVACMQLGRRFIGCEIDEDYFATAEKRIREAAEQPPLFTLDNTEAQAEQLGLFDE